MDYDKKPSHATVPLKILMRETLAFLRNKQI